MGRPQATLARDEIVVGRAYQRTITLEASPAFEHGNDDLAAILVDGATATALVVDSDGSTVLTLTPLVTAASRTLLLTATAAATAGLTPGLYRWKVSVATAFGSFPVRFLDDPQVRRLP